MTDAPFTETPTQAEAWRSGMALRDRIRELEQERDRLTAERDASMTDAPFAEMDRLRAMAQALRQWERDLPVENGFATALEQAADEIDRLTLATTRANEGNAHLTAENERLTQAGQEMAEELHAAINEPMYSAGTRADWMHRAQRAEAEIDRLRAALEEVAHHADDEAGFMVTVRAALREQR